MRLATHKLCPVSAAHTHTLPTSEMQVQYDASGDHHSAAGGERDQHARADKLTKQHLVGAIAESSGLAGLDGTATWTLRPIRVGRNTAYAKRRFSWLFHLFSAIGLAGSERD